MNGNEIRYYHDRCGGWSLDHLFGVSHTVEDRDFVL